MKQQIIRHGEVLLKPSELPKGAELQSETNELVVAHSETGHHHILKTVEKSKFKVYKSENDTYFELPVVGNLIHQKTGADVHAPHKVAPGIYKVGKKVEFDYFARKIREVRD